MNIRGIALGIVLGLFAGTAIHASAQLNRTAVSVLTPILQQ